MKQTLRVFTILMIFVNLNVALAAEQKEESSLWRSEIGLGSARYESDNVTIGFGRLLGETHRGYVKNYLNYDLGMRNMQGIVTTGDTSLDTIFHQISLSMESGCLNNFCADTSIGVIYAHVDKDLFDDSYNLGFSIRVGGAFKLATNPNGPSWLSQSALLIHMNGWFGFDKPTGSSTNVYNGFFPTVGSRITF